MTWPGLDEDWQRLSPAQVAAAGRTFVVGYVSEDTTGKNITRAEVDAYLAAGVAVLLVYEYSTTAIAGGAPRGARDAGIGVSQVRALGYPAGCALAFAVDENTSSNPSAVDGYARAFTAACHAARYRSMDYGGYATVKRCADLGLTDLHWQTYAWSGVPTVWDPRATIRQVQNAVTIADKAVDLDTAMVGDFGAWMPNSSGGGQNEMIDYSQQVPDGPARAGNPGRTIGQWIGDVWAETFGVPNQLAAVAGKLDALAASPAPVVLTDADRTAIAQQVAAALAPLVAAATADELARRLGNG